MKLELNSTYSARDLTMSIEQAKRDLLSHSDAYYFYAFLGSVLSCAEIYVRDPKKEGCLTDQVKNIALSRYEQLNLIFNKGVALGQVDASQDDKSEQVKEYYVSIINTLDAMPLERTLRVTCLEAAQKSYQDFLHDLESKRQKEAVRGIMFGLMGTSVLFMALTKKPMWFLGLSVVSYAAAKVPMKSYWITKEDRSLLHTIVANDNDALNAGCYFNAMVNFNRISNVFTTTGDAALTFFEKSAVVVHKVVNDFDPAQAVTVIEQSARVFSTPFDQEGSTSIKFSHGGDGASISIQTKQSSSWRTMDSFFKAVSRVIPVLIADDANSQKKEIKNITPSEANNLTITAKEKKSKNESFRSFPRW